MLHILLVILKIIGIILAVILGIIILLLGVVLFVPVRYEISAKYDDNIDTLRLKMKVTWLLHLFRADLFVKGKKLKWKLRAAWIKKTSFASMEERKDEKSYESEDGNTQETEEKVIKSESADKTAEIHEEKFEAHTDKIKGNQSAAEKNKDKFEVIRSKIDSFIQKKKKISDLITDETHINAFKKLKKELFILLKKLKPKLLQINLRFGFDDPSVTGKVLGGLGILYPFLGDGTEIIPDFEKQILKGNVYIKGRIRICHIANMVVKLLLCKDIRKSYKDIKNYKL